MLTKVLNVAMRYPKHIMALAVFAVVVSIAQFPRIRVDTDPQNMLSDQAPVKVTHRQVRAEFALYDFVVLGVVNDADPDGVFNPQTLEKLYRITEEIKKIPGVIVPEIITLSTRDDVRQADLGTVEFQWLMSAPPKSREEARQTRERAEAHPMFRDSIVSSDGQAVAVYVPIEKKTLSYAVAQAIRKIVAGEQGAERYYVTGLPVAEDQFGVEMFKQMAISAPLAGLVIFVLMWIFFKSAVLIIGPMLVALVTVVISMGLLMAFGYPVHIMSSMIPIFLMPIAVLDSVHILSEFFDKYRTFNDRPKTIRVVFEELFTPMLYTSLTSIAGFVSLSFSDIPPVQVFGVFVAIGIAIAWILTMVFIPAYIMLIPERRFVDFGHPEESGGHLIDRILGWMKRVCLRRAKAVLIVSVMVVAVSLYGISRVQVNDNPVRWFNTAHPLRVADRVLNRHFAGTYESYLVFESRDSEEELFIEPAMLRYLERFQQALAGTGLVGKTTSLGDVVKKVYYELLGGNPRDERIPDSKAAVAQCLISFENSHRPDDVWHMTTPDYSKTNIWFQLKSGDNKDMVRVLAFVDDYIANNPPPYQVTYKWAGSTYINVIWQDNMVKGMLNNFIGSYIIVLFMMLYLFRSPLKALLSMIPLTVTILFIYSLLGFFGKDYDMPVAVLSALTLGLSVDFAIHFIQRALELYRETGSWEKTADEMFQGPGRAIIRNALVVAIGFLPLLAAPLVPYKTVGFFMFMIMAVSSLSTLFLLPALATLVPKAFFEDPRGGTGCHCGACVLSAGFVAAAVAYVLIGYSPLGWRPTVFVEIGIIAAAAGICRRLSGRTRCKTEEGMNG